MLDKLSLVFLMWIVQRCCKGHEVFQVIHSPLSGNQHWPQQGHNRFHANIKLICLKESAVTSRLSAIKRAWVKFNWMRWVATVDIESCWADEMDSLRQLKIMSFTQSAWEGIWLLFQLLPGDFRGSIWDRRSRQAVHCCPAVCGEAWHSVLNDFSSGKAAHTVSSSWGPFNSVTE